MVDELLEKYWDESMGGNPDLESFTRRLAQGKLGDVSTEHIRAFLQRVEEITIANIETKADEGAPFAAMRDEVIAETKRQIADLIAEYGTENG